jgi:tetratricopeptide (TPR) repeat protein
VQLTSHTLQKTSLVLICFLVFSLPLFFAPTTSDIFYLNKQTLLLIITGLLLVLTAACFALNRSIRLTQTPFNLPLLLLALSFILSTAIKSQNLQLTLSYPLSIANILTLILLFFLITHTIKTKKELNFVILSLIASSTLLAIHSIYQLIGLGKLIPYPFAQAPSFTPAGSTLNLLCLLILSLPFSLYLALKNLSKKSLLAPFLFLATIIILLSLALNFNLIFIKKQNPPVFLDHQTSWQVAFESLKISPLVGIGPGNYLYAFTQFKPAVFARTPQWNTLFSSASNYYLQILTENGVFGLVAIALLVFFFLRLLPQALSKVPETLPEIASLSLIFIFYLFIPSNFLTTFLLFLFLSTFVLKLKFKNHQVHDFILSLFTLSIVQTETPPSLPTEALAKAGKKIDEIFTKILFILTLIFTILVFYFQSKVYTANYYFNQSLDAASENRGTDTYNFQMKAVKTFPSSDTYRLAYAQTNLALANTLARQESLSDQDRQNIRQLISQAIREAKAATALAPLSSQTWENLARIYSQLVNFAQGADQWAIASYNQAVNLDRYNPRLILDAGGFFYNLQKFDEAAGLFQVAVNLKPDYANAYYNLSAALREKKDFDKAIEALKKALELVPKDSQDFAKVRQELTSLEETAKKAKTTAAEEETPSETLAKPSPLPKGDNMPAVTLQKEDAPPLPATPSSTISPAP